jgi:hypothetical protein
MELYRGASSISRESTFRKGDGVCDRESVAEVELCDRMSAGLTQKRWLC